MIEEENIKLETRQSPKKLPNDVPVLVLGIISVAMCGVGLVTGIIALSLSSKSMAMYKENPEGYLETSYSQLNAGRICAIIGICISSLVVLFYIVYFGFFFTVMAGAAASQAT